jgi:hypothetical protein
MQIKILLQRAGDWRSSSLVDLAVALPERWPGGELRRKRSVHGPDVADRELGQQLIEDRAAFA